MTWRNTWKCGPGAGQWVLDDLELGPRVAMPWASGRMGCVTDLAGPGRLRALDPAPPPHHPQRPAGPLTLFGPGSNGA